MVRLHQETLWQIAELMGAATAEDVERAEALVTDDDRLFAQRLTTAGFLAEYGQPVQERIDGLVTMMGVGRLLGIVPEDWVQVD